MTPGWDHWSYILSRTPPHPGRYASFNTGINQQPLRVAPGWGNWSVASPVPQPTLGAGPNSFEPPSPHHPSPLSPPLLTDQPLTLSLRVSSMVSPSLHRRGWPVLLSFPAVTYSETGELAPGSPYAYCCFPLSNCLPSPSILSLASVFLLCSLHPGLYP